MSKKTIQLTFDWEKVHETMSEVDKARGRGWGIIGRDGCFDVFGGSYFGYHYERRGFPGLLALYHACEKMRNQVWDIVHGGKKSLDEALQPTDLDTRIVYWSTGFYDREPKKHQTHRGAAWRATRFNGVVVKEKEIIQSKIDERVIGIKMRIRSAIKTAIALDKAFRLFKEIGICEYSSLTICAVHDGRINLCGIRWLAGERKEPDIPPTVDEALMVYNQIHPMAS